MRNAVLSLGIGLALLASTSWPAHAQDTRSFSMGFTDYSHDLITEPGASDQTVLTVAQLGDLLVIHEEDSIPWPEALLNLPNSYHPEYLSFIQQRAVRRYAITPNHKVFLYLNVLNLARDGIAGYRGDTNGKPLPAPFDSLKTSFADPRVVTAFVNHASYMISVFRPSYFAYGIEANMLLSNIRAGRVKPEVWPEFVAGSYQIYLLLKLRYPALPIFFSIQIDEFNKDRAFQTEGLRHLMPVTDLIAVSSYAYGSGYRVYNLPADYFTAVRALDPSKKYAVAETGWPGEPVFYPDPLPAGQQPQYYFESNAFDQLLYVDRLLKEADANKAEFVNWFVVRDYDRAWDRQFKDLPIAWLIRLWRDIGLLDGNGFPRWSALTWVAYLWRPRTGGIE
jgi:hypothetical protein